MVKPLILTGQIADKTDLITPLQKLLASKKLCYQQQPPAACLGCYRRFRSGRFCNGIIGTGSCGI